MSKNTRITKTRHGSSGRPLGAIRLTQGTPPHSNASRRNDPALLINQIQSPRTSSPQDHLIKEKEQEFKAKERRLKDHISALEKLIAELKLELKTKTELLEAAKKTLDDKIKEYEEKLAAKVAECNELISKLESSEAEVATKQKQVNDLTIAYEQRIKDMKDEQENKIASKCVQQLHTKSLAYKLFQHERQLQKMQEDKDAELKQRDEKLQVLKQRMAETIGKNSNERQHQLEELKKDLIKASQEAKELQRQLKYTQLNPPKCKNCARLETQLDEKSLQVRLKDKTINDLQNIGKSMQIQLTQQDMILTKWEEKEKGEHKL